MEKRFRVVTDVLRNNRTVIILSFDDGRADQFRTAKYLQEQKLPAVFNIATGYLEGNCPNITNVPPMSEQEVQWIAGQSDFEIAAHGDLHENSVQDIIKGREKLFKLVSRYGSIESEESALMEDGLLTEVGFASPGSKMSPDFIKRHKKQLKRLRFLYVRTGSSVRTFRRIRLFCRKVGRIVHLPVLYKIAYKESLVDGTEKFCFTSVPIMADTTLREVKAIVDLAVREQKVCVLMFHSILESDKREERDLWTWDRSRFERLVQYLRELQDRSELSVMNVRQYLELK